MGPSSTGSGRHGFVHAGPVLGVEPAIEAVARRHGAGDRRLVSKRWLAGTVLTALAGGGLIGIAIYAALDRQAIVVQAPEFAVLTRKDGADDGSGPQKGDRLVKRVDVVAEKQAFRAPTTVSVGDKQVVRLRDYTHVATTLTVTPTDLADQVPPFNPLKLLAGDAPDATGDAPADPGPALDAEDVAFVTSDLSATDPAAFLPGLSRAEVAAQVARQLKADGAAGAKPPLALPPQLLLMLTSRAGVEAAGALAFANPAEGPSARAASLQVKMVPENVTAVARQDMLHEAGQLEDRLVILRHGDTIDNVLKANGATPEQVRAIVDAFGAARGEPPVAEGRRVRLLLAETEDRPGLQIARVSVYADETLETTIAVDDDGRYVKVEAAEPVARPSPSASGDEDDEGGAGLRLYDSIYQTALKQQIPPGVIATMIRIFANDIDFQQSVQGGDSFDAFYTSDDDDRPDLLFASITVRNDVYRYYRFQMPDETASEFFDDNGRSMRKFLIRTPVPAGVFTSGFGMRFHPILGYSRPHTGVDWAAAVGTPILAAGNGTVLTAERSSSYGNHVEIQHANGYITTYSHMVGFARGLTEGVKVRQGQVIGYLGQTGLATGPHLHYEVIVNGHFVDPMRVKLARSRDIEGKPLADFKREHDRIDALMASAPNPVSSPQKRASN